MVADYKALIASAKASGLIREAKRRKYNPELRSRAHIDAQQVKIAAACNQLLADVEASRGRLGYGLVSFVAHEYGVNPQSLRNALGRRRQRLEARA